MNALKTNFFLAVPLPDDVQKLLKQQALRLQSEYPFKSWVSDPREYHITLFFLGKNVSARLEQLKNKLGPVVAQYSPFRISVDHIGTFGKKGRPSVLWAGMHTEETMYALQRDVHTLCGNIGFQIDDKPFHPHITLARKWNSSYTFNDSDLKKDVPFNCDQNSWVANEIVLYQSHPQQTPRYRIVERFPLGG